MTAPRSLLATAWASFASAAPAVVVTLAFLALVAAPRAPVVAQTAGAALQQGGAAEAAAIERQGPADDEVTFELSVEDWVETRTATVRLAADLAVESGRFDAARQDLVATLRGLDAGAEWRVVDFSKLGDDAGFERWNVVAEARVPEAVVGGLASKLREATRPGRALKVDAIDYTPTRAEREAVLERLRGQIYARVGGEIAALNAAFPDRRFRVRVIDLSPGFRPEQRAMPMVATMRGDAAPKAADASGWLAGSEKAILAARVVLAAAVD